MAVEDIVKKKIGRELQEWVYLGVRTGMRRAVDDYRKLVTLGDTEQAEQVMKRCLNLPHRARLRIQSFIDNFATNYPDETQTGVQYIADCLALNSTVTIGELNTALNSMEAICITWRDQILAETRTWDQIATIIENNVEHEASRWMFIIPSGELDIWGDQY